MKHVLLSILLLSFFNTAAFAQVLNEPLEASEESNPNVNLDEIQFIFSNLVNDLVDTYDYLEEGSVFIDQEVTDLDIGKFKLSLGAKTTPLKWETSEELHTIEITAGLETDVKLSSDGLNKVVDVKGLIEFKTNVMPFLKQVVLALGDCEIIPAADIIDRDDEFANIFCTAFTGVRESENVKELKPYLEKAVELAKAYAASQEEANDIIIEILNQLTIIETESGLDIAAALDINAFNIKTDELLLSATEDGLSLVFSGSAELVEEDFNHYLNTLNTILVDIANYETNDDSPYWVIESYAFTIFDIIEGFILVE